MHKESAAIKWSLSFHKQSLNCHHSVSSCTYLALVSSKYLGSGAKLIREIKSIFFNRISIASHVKNIFIKWNIVRRPVTCLKYISLVSTFYIPIDVYELTLPPHVCECLSIDNIMHLVVFHIAFPSPVSFYRFSFPALR